MEKKKLFAPVWRHWKHAVYKYRYLVIGTFVFYGTTTFLNDVYKAIIWKRIVDMLGEHKNPMTLFLAIPAIGVITWILNRLADYCIVRSESNIIRYLKNYALQHILSCETNYFLNTFVGSIVAKSRRFAMVTETVYDEFAYIILRIIVLLTGVLCVVIQTIPVVGYILLAWSILFGLISWYISRKRAEFSFESANADSATTGHLSDIVGVVHLIHSYVREQHEYEGFKKTTSFEHAHRYRKWLHENLQSAIQAALVVLLEVVLIYIVVQKAMDGLVTVGTVVLVQSYIAAVTSHMWNFGRSIATIQNAFADAEEMSTVISQKIDSGHTEIVPTRSIDEIENFRIELSSVIFSYPGRNMSVLKDVSISFESGCRYGIVGYTGGGKTTITRLLQRQFDLPKDCGTITVGGISIYDLPKHELRNLISYVSQDTHFPFRTVREIIAFGKPDATEEEIISAAKKASCHDFIIEQLEYGYETKVGEQGVKLSGGQRQRLAIAVAFLKDAPIIILDEPTAALDSETEEAIQTVLKTMTNKTLIVIAHRLATVAVLDEIIVLKNGTVEEQGSHSDLLQKNGSYASFWKKQFDL